MALVEVIMISNESVVISNFWHEIRTIRRNSNNSSYLAYSPQIFNVFRVVKYGMINDYLHTKTRLSGRTTDCTEYNRSTCSTSAQPPPFP